MKKRGLYAVTNPGSNTKLASGIAPIKEYLECGIPVAIGTDGPASNNCLDMFREMFLVTGLAKLRNMDASSVDALEVLKMATVNGARAMGLNDADYLAEGKLADIIMLDLNQPNMQPINNIEKNIVYSGSKSNVLMTMIGGIIRYENGKFNIGADPSEIYAKAEEIKKRIYNS
jgi:5-methylthioadenosine/S-adenosylhomocysteine deaminase